MIFTPFAFMATPSGGVDPDVAAFLTATGITDTTTVNAITDLVADLKGNTTAGGGTFWAALDIIYPFVGTSATSMKYNLKDTTQYTLTFNGTNTFSSNGLDFGGTTSDYAQTGWVPSANLNNWSGNLGLTIGNYRANAYTGTQSAWGTLAGGIRLMEFGFQGSGYFDCPASLRMNSGAWVGAGSYIVVMDNNVGANTCANYVYKNGVNSANTSGNLSSVRTSANAPTSEILLGKRTDGFPYPGTLSHWWLGETFNTTTPNDTATLDGIFNDFQTALSRNLY